MTAKKKSPRKAPTKEAPDGQAPAQLGFRPLTSFASQPAGWLWEPYVPLGCLTIITGAEGTGKSTLLSRLLADAAGGPRLGPGPERRGTRAASLPGEESVGNDLRPRLAVLLGPRRVDRVSVLGADDDGRHPLHLPSGLRRFRDLVTLLGPLAVGIDPVVSYLDRGASVDALQVVREVLEGLQSLAASVGAAVVGVHHPGKASGNELIGSSAWRQVPRMVLSLRQSNTPGEFSLRVIKRSGGPLPPPLSYRLEGKEDGPRVWAPMGAADRTQELIAREGETAGERSRLLEACRLLRAVLGEGRLEATAVIEAGRREGIGERLLYDAKRALSIPSTREGFGRGQIAYWVPPPDWPDWLSRSVEG